jgi:glycosyltransferase involved in cell wall biosynthesis
MLEELQDYTQKCDRIKYMGSLPNDQVLSLEREATLLINPRKADHLLTRYSFPSKTFEYFSSGTPAVLTKLEGIPEEYYQYCYTCDSTSAESLASDLDTVLDIPFEIRLKKAKEAFRFVKEKKSAKVQTQRIVNFLNEIK